MPNALILLFVILLVILAIVLLSRRTAAGHGKQGESPSPGGLRGHVLRDIQFIRQVLTEIPIADDRRNAFNAQLGSLEARVNRRLLHLAVIGEFNSGKSTFINALLRQRVLKSANIATTASATEIRYGAELRVTVRLTNGALASATEGNWAALATELDRFPLKRRQPQTLLEWIELLTADPETSRVVSAVEIEAPAEWLSQGVCIIDTPGVGAGPDNARHHQTVTERILADQADAAVVLTPADGCCSNTLLAFLDSTARPFLNRCIFIITKLDRVDAEQRALIVSHANLKLTQFLNAPPVLLEAGPLAILLPPTVDSDAVDSDKEENYNYWRAEFNKLELFLRDSMSVRGPVIVAETLVRLLHQAISDLDAVIEVRREEVQHQQRTLEANSILRIEHVLGELRNQCQSAMNESLRRIGWDLDRASERFETGAKQAIQSLLDGAVWGNLKDIVSEKIPGVLAEQEGTFNQTTNSSFAQLDEQCAAAHQLFASQFESCYSNLKPLGIPTLHRSVAAIPRTRVYTGRFMGTTPFSNGPRWRDWAGIALNREKKRQELRTMLFPAVAAHVQSATAQWRSRLGQASATITTELNQAVRLHLQNYAATVNAMIRQHESARAALENEQARMHAHTTALRQRAATLNEVKQNLVGVAQPGAALALS
jgi:hypothetical protein